MAAKRRRRPAPRVPDILDTRAAASFLTVSPATVVKLIKAGDLPARKVGRKWIMSKPAIIRWVESGSGQVQKDRAAAGDKKALMAALNSGNARIRGKSE